MDKNYKYKAILFSVDGEYVTDCKAETIDEVWDEVNDMGSRWVFYPIAMVITYNYGWTERTQRIVDAPEQLGWAKGKSIKTVSDVLAADSDFFAQLIQG